MYKRQAQSREDRISIGMGLSAKDLVECRSFRTCMSGLPPFLSGGGSTMLSLRAVPERRLPEMTARSGLRA